MSIDKDSHNNGGAAVDSNRRKFIKLTSMGTLSAGLFGISSFTRADGKVVETKARIVIVGAGAAGISLANRLARATSGAEITIIDERERHLYQPGLTLVATGVWDTHSVLDSNSRYIPRSVKWLKNSVVQFDPDNNRVQTNDNSWIAYDYLLVATGLELNFSAIEGMDASLIGTKGIGCVYDNPEHASRTWQQMESFINEGGVGIFTRAPGAIKCAGAPLKVAMLFEHDLRQRNVRDRFDLQYTAPAVGLFSQPDVNEFLKGHFPERGININWNHRLTGIDADTKRATFATDSGSQTLDYDFIHVVPPMQAPSSIRESSLAWDSGPFAVGGWLEVDQHTMQHRRYPNVFGAGDCVGTPIGKTAASVKAQVPVVVHNLLRVMEGSSADASYNGYTSCPLITERGEAMLVEFDYDLKMIPSFGFINPMKAQWVPWIMKDKMLRGAYNAMLRGRV